PRDPPRGRAALRGGSSRPVGPGRRDAPGGSLRMTARGWNLLSDAQASVARGFVAEQAAARHHLVVYLSGSDAYGFPSPDSDLDLKCVHVAPTRALVGLHPDEGSAERMEMREGVEIDYGSNELGAVLLGVLRGNGNYLERLLGELALAADEARLVE